MTTFKKIFSQFVLALLMTGPFVTLAPAYALASTPSTSNTTATTPSSGSFDSSSLTVESRSKPRITGMADVSKIRVTVTASTTGKVLYKSGRTSVHSGAWRVSIRKKLPDGIYPISLYQDNRGKLTLLATSSLYVGAQPVTLKVAPIALLGGGTAAPGSTVPISYLQVVNQSDATTTIAGFWVKQNGNAPVKTIIGLSSVDDKGNYRMSTGGIEGKTPFVGGQGYVPSGAVIGPRQMKLFTIKAQLSATAGDSAGSNLMLDVSGVDAPVSFNAVFPIRGTTWVISR